ncbi:MAG: ATP synthase subunit I [Methylicorpusculum sp.]|uniref:ATP synthase subunit I n=2 Tax=Methylicorpusculum sp. TaxID=2713644 RepID=UPI00271C682A|nr:ATP synthase subunit I [Methylicorpusculum sp.]MDO8845719.1 ATP synthase subunit I [Methylicorpusculum sp.]MDO8940443.1 ATP synthase subunit I [Methylicorpusculum sp.]MDP2177328.1 ATP synthase subunit I [Methylicorpusculum sp.]MDP3531025.1 ATP synthase subunit I [Methylicorpusculum sp.]MDZ4153779.1 ATP synthase subunit I [Methylicorpusculum sp.]
MADNQLSSMSKILTLQGILIIVTSAGFAIFRGLPSAYSPFMGGIVAFLPNLYFILWVFRANGQNAKKIVNSFYAGESGKLILTALLFFLVFQLPDIEFLPLLTGYVAALSVFWFALILRW